MVKNISDEEILIMEKTTYDYYKNSKLNKYLIKYLDNAAVSNSFLLNKDNNVYTINYGMSSESGMGAASLLSQYLESYKGYLQQEKLSSLNVNAKDVLQVIEIREEG